MILKDATNDCSFAEKAARMRVSVPVELVILVYKNNLLSNHLGCCFSLHKHLQYSTLVVVDKIKLASYAT